MFLIIILTSRNKRGIINSLWYAGVAELADAPDLGSGGYPVQVQVLSPAPTKVTQFLSCFRL